MLERETFPVIVMQKDKVVALSSRQIQIFELEACGLTRAKIAEKLGINLDLVKRDIREVINGSSDISMMHIISKLFDSGQINKAKVAEGLDFNRYQFLSKREKEVLDYVSKDSTWKKHEDEIAKDLNISTNTIKIHFNSISSILALNSPNVLLRSRVFMLLMSKDREMITSKEFFPEQLKDYRRSLGLSQRELGAISAVDHTVISRLERGALEPSITTFFALTTSLNLSKEQTAKLIESAHKFYKNRDAKISSEENYK